MEIPPHLHERYGIRKKRFPFAVVAGVLVILSLVLYSIFVQNQVSIRLVTWTTNASSVTIDWRYEGQLSGPVWCVLEAQDENRFDIGFAYFQLRQSDTNKILQHTLTTTESAFAVLTPICDADISRLPGSYFKPGVLPPAQLPPLFAPWQLP